MKTTSIALSCAALVLIFPAIARTSARRIAPAGPWVGLRQAPLEGLPRVILTLSDDSGRLMGGIVFSAVSRHDTPSCMIGCHALAIVNLRVDGYMLRVEVIPDGHSLERERPRV